MRIGVLFRANVPNIFYRAYEPMTALGKLGHDIRVIELRDERRLDTKVFRGCDVVHVYRDCSQSTLALVDDVRRRGGAVTWDNDDDIRLLPPEAPHYGQMGGLAAQQTFNTQKKMLRRVHLVTTTSSLLADRYEAAGAPETFTIENYLGDYQYTSASSKSDGVVVGWVAGVEHLADTKALAITELLQRLMNRHPRIRVVTIGLRLPLDGARYEHRPPVPFPTLSQHISTFDIGIAPLGDVPMSHARSNVKVKEYAAAGVPWLASARGPYAGLGPLQGGMLVGDNGWEAALDALIGSRFKRMKLRRKGIAWAKSQRLSDHVYEWHAAFERAVALAGTRREAIARGTRASIR